MGMEKVHDHYHAVSESICGSWSHDKAWGTFIKVVHQFLDMLQGMCDRMDKSHHTINKQQVNETAPDLNSAAVFFPGFNPITNAPKHGWLYQIMYKLKTSEATLVDNTNMLRDVLVSVDLDQEQIHTVCKRFVLFSFPIS